MAKRAILWGARSVLVVGMLPLVGCVTSVKTETRYEITQQATLPAPGGPESVGRMTPPGKASVQGGARIVHVRVADSEKDRAEIGHEMLDRTFHGRIAYGVGEKLELGFSGLYGNSVWTQHTSDVELSSPSKKESEITHIFWGGVQLRRIVVGNQFNGIGAFGELSVGRAPYLRTVNKTTTTYYDGLFVPDEPTVTEEEYTEESAAMNLNSRFGVQGFVSLGEWITVNGGGMLQFYPRYWGRRVTGQVCESELYQLDDGQFASCTGDTPDTMRDHNQITFGTVFLGGSIGGEHLPGSLHLQVFYHALAPSIIRNTSPIGADMALRLEF